MRKNKQTKQNKQVNANSDVQCLGRTRRLKAVAKCQSKKAASAECVFWRLDLSLKFLFSLSFLSTFGFLFSSKLTCHPKLKDLDFSVFLSHSSSSSVVTLIFKNPQFLFSSVMRDEPRFPVFVFVLLCGSQDLFINTDCYHHSAIRNLMDRYIQL